MISKYSVHEVANLFPMMSEDEFAALVGDIKENGQREPITVYQNQIIDGRNRYKACEQLGLKPQVREWDGQGSLVSLVISLNLKRRHLTGSQKATIAADMLPMLEAEAKERQIKSAEHTNAKLGRASNETVSQKIDGSSKDENEGKATEQAAKLVGTNRQYVSDAKKIKQDAPEIFDMMKSGEININTAKQYASLPQETRGKLLDNKPKQEEGKTKACNECGELLPIEKFPAKALICYSCRHQKYYKQKADEAVVEEVDEKQEWLDSQVKTFNGHLNQMMMFMERTNNLDEIISQGIIDSRKYYIDAADVLQKVSNALKNKINGSVE